MVYYIDECVLNCKGILKKEAMGVEAMGVEAMGVEH
jgi:hypothetical protein